MKLQSRTNLNDSIKTIEPLEQKKTMLITSLLKRARRFNFTKSMVSVVISIAALLMFSSAVIADDDLKSKARGAIAAGNFSDAIPLLEHVDPQQRTNTDTIALALSYLRTDHHEHAEALTKQVLSKSPGNDEALWLLADTYADQGKWEDALPLYFNAALAKDAPALRWLRVGQVLQVMEEPELAELAFQMHSVLMRIER